MKDRYSVDEYNRLTITTGKKGADAEELIPRGKFTIDEKNNLSYIIFEPQPWRIKYDLPRKITLKGTWSLDKDHNLVCTLYKTETRYRGEQLQLTTEMKGAASNALVFSLRGKKESGIYQTRLLKLQGKWQADRNNRLCFLAQKTRSRYDTLTLQGTWEVKKNVLIYRYRKTRLKKELRREHALIFKGFWSLSRKNRLAYILDAKNNSYFSFKAHLETPSISGKSGTIKYRVGIGLTKEPSKSRLITLYGTWKFGKRAQLSFEINYGKGRAREIEFGARVRVTDKNEVAFQLKNDKGGDMGMGVTFTRALLRRNARLFLRLEEMRKNPRIEAGASIPW